jgi:CubicO group peptidase (beta-lactamase class C family)
LVIKDDTILYERYFQGHTQSSISQAFSTSKSILSILIGVAVDEGLIKSVDQPVTDFVPELADNGFGNVTIESLLQMRSGMDYVEDDNLFGEHVRFNLTTSLEAQILKLQMNEEPSEAFIYKSGDNALLALILDRALGAKTITEYTQEKLWTPLGMEYDGIWSIDHEGDGLEKTWCCLAATWPNSSYTSTSASSGTVTGAGSYTSPDSNASSQTNSHFSAASCTNTSSS